MEQTQEQKRELTRRLLAWYDANRRILPWREDPTPYHVWVSEIMLQQTRVEAVLGYYERFMDELPDVRSLAQASDDLCLKLWEGLGYYSRVRNLHKAAKVIMEEYKGEIPRTQAELRKLPGIGAYTSAAIASIAFRERTPAIDGNFLRVFARMTFYPDNIKSEEARKEAAGYFSDRISEERPGDYNQAMMDLGATICIPHGDPLCLVCPWQDECQAHQRITGQEARLPQMPEKKKKPVTRLTVFLIRLSLHEPERGEGAVEGRAISRVPHGRAQLALAASQQHHDSMPNGRTLSGSQKNEKVIIRRRPENGLLAGLYEFPNTQGWLSRKEAEEYLGTLGIRREQIQTITALPPARHVFTHREWHMHGYEVTADGLPGQEYAADLIFTDPSGMAKVYTIPSAFNAYETRLFQEITKAAL